MAVPENSTVRWFTSDMAGAPPLTDAPGSIIAILDACLLNGFGQATPDGDKITVNDGVATVEFSAGNTFERHAVVEISGAMPTALNDVWRVTGATATTFTFDCPDVPDGIASGAISVKRATPGHWEKAFGGDLVAAYRSTHPNSTGMYLRVDDSLPINHEFRIPVRGYASMTTIDTGDGAFPTHEDRPEDNPDSNHLWIRHNRDSADYLPAPWAVIADERFIWYLPSVHDHRGAALYQFGDISAPVTADVFNCVITGHYQGYRFANERTQQHCATLGYTAGCYFSASSDGSLNGVPYSRVGLSAKTKYVFQNYESADPFPNPITGGYLFAPLQAYDDRCWRGTVPGIKQILTYLGDNGFNDAEQHRLLNPGFGLDRSVLMVNVGTRYSDRYYAAAAFDIWGPWR